MRKKLRLKYNKLRAGFVSRFRIEELQSENGELRTEELRSENSELRLETGEASPIDDDSCHGGFFYQ